VLALIGGASTSPTTTTTEIPMSDGIALSKYALAAIEAYEKVTGFTVDITIDPDHTITWTDILPTGDTHTTVIPADDTTARTGT
jgi:hypothetical protein